MRRITETHEGILLFVCSGDRQSDPDAEVKVFFESQSTKAEKAAAALSCEVVEEEGLFIRVRSPEGEEIIGWQGPFDSLSEAYEHLRDEHQYDAQTGQELDECGDPVELDEDDFEGGGDPGFAGFDDY